MKIGLAIRSARKNIRLSERDLASMVGVRSTIIRQIEKDELVVSLHFTQKIARVLGLDINRLATIAGAILEPENETKNLRCKLLLSVQPILFQFERAR